ncbi:FdhC protein [Candidatus Epulonipiscium fishelsonii]|uniref:FdhC protein n=1 Tax=Candidatus Epulonipiscium fishelsonii TaxID=77094 RepID=A0ACC8XB97_9FIRM|nr:FdhC protein [Epulopiscium sp. SCG-B11WGA-EpuloA1]ONI41281.1 FdhC protein [Epulopiscium sp. SCG-B05WGA-EpuloA1]
MAAKNYLTPPEITDYTIDAGVSKVNRNFMTILFMAILAGIYIALGGIASSTAAHSVDDYGLAKLITGAVFPVGLMLVVINGADLFTGNCLIIMSTCDKKTNIFQFFGNIAIVFFGNFIGAVFMAWLQANSGLFRMSDGGFAYYVFKTAYNKVTLPFDEALILGIICNIFVCAGILMTYAAKDIAGKALAEFFSIFAFAISGSEHIVANMYYVPAAIFAKSNPDLIELSGYASEKLSEITWGNFFIHNAIPVTIGNILGGVLIGTMYYLIYKKFTR